jgi:uncharacterized RDD family membrane protein YckC
MSGEKVNLLKRGIAAVLDIYISSVLANIPVLFIYSIKTGETQLPRDLSSLPALSGSLICLMEIIMILVYYIILPVYKFKGQTLMKKLFGFRVVKTDGSNVDVSTLLKRELLGSMIVEGGFAMSGEYFRQFILIITGLDSLHKMLVYISYALSILSVIFMVFLKDNKALHDFIAGTKVVKVSK